MADPHATPRSRWNLRLGRVAGIELRMHATFLILLAWIAIADLVAGHGVRGAAAGVLLIVCVFAIVVVHELAHALVARRFGVQTRAITLLPIGGVSSLERIPDNPRQELAIALAGPSVNVVLAALLFGVLALVAHGPVAPGAGHDAARAFVSQLAWINVGLAVFNLLPAFPMDGGRVLRAALALRMDYDRATRAAARLGRIVAVGFAIFGFFFNPLLVFIALFVWIGAQQEATSVHLKQALAGVPVERAMVTRFLTLSPDDSLTRALQLALGGFQGSFPVVDHGHLVGVLTREAVAQALRSVGPEVAVGQVMRRDFDVIGSHDPVEAVLPKLAGAGATPVVVLDGGHVVGMITPDSIAELLLVERASRAQPN